MPQSHENFLKYVERYLGQKDYLHAFPLFQLELLPDLLQLSPDLLKCVLSHAHTFVLFLSDNKEVQQLYETIKTKLQQAPFDLTEIQINFYQTASQTYIQLNDYLKALNYASQALWLAERSSSLPSASLSSSSSSSSSSKQLPDIHCLLDKIDVLIQQEQLTQLWKASIPACLAALPSKQEPPLLDPLKRITPLVTLYLRLGSVERIAVLYEALKLLLERWTNWANTRLKVTHQNTLEEFTEAVESIRPVVRLFEEHQQWQQALDIYYIIRNYHNQATAKNLVAKDYDAAKIKEKIALLNQYILHTAEPPKVKARSDWMIWREQLTQYREVLRKALLSDEEVLKSQADFTEQVKNLLKTIVQLIIDLLGDPPMAMPAEHDTPHPCGFSLLGLGSLARADMCPYSDVDIALLIEDEALRDHPYFQALICLFQLKVSLIGEPNGFWVDEGDISYLTGKEKLQLNTPEGLLKHYHPKKIEACEQPETHAIHRPVLIYANETGARLLDEYQRLLHQAFQATDETTYDLSMSLSRVWALKHLEMCQHQYLQDKNKTKSAVDLKENFIRPITLWCLDMQLYFAPTIKGPTIKESAIVKLLKALEKHIHPDFLSQVHEAISQCQKTRILLQFEKRQQVDVLSDPSTEQQLQFNTIKTYLIKIAWMMSQIQFLPDEATAFYPTVVYLEQHVLGHLKSTEPDLTRVVTYLVNTLILQETSFERHQEIYRKLSTYVGAERLRKSYLDSLQASAPAQHAWRQLLADIPDPVGYRQSERLAYQELMEKCQRICLPVAYSSSSVSAVAFSTEGMTVYLTWMDEAGNINKQLLRPNLMTDLVDTDGQLQRQFQNSRHRVRKLSLAAGQGLYFKAMPDQPTMDYAMDILHRRLIGHGTPPSLLVKLTVEGLPSGKSLSYPVVISSDMGSCTLQTVLKVQGPTFAIDSTHYTELVLVSLLTSSGDGASRNYVVHENSSGATLICIDNEQQFVEPVVKKVSVKGLNKVQFQNILFCLAQANQPLDMETLKKFCEQKHLYNCISEWIKTVLAREKTYDQLFSDTEERRQLYTQNNDYRFTTNFLIREGVIGELLINLNYLQIHIQLLLQAKELPSVLDLLSIINPRLGQYYRTAHKAHPDPEQRFKAATNAPQKSVTSSLAIKASLGIIPSFAEVESKDRYSLREAHKEVQALLDFKPDFSKLVDREGKPDINRQKILLKALALYPHTELSLSHCMVLTNEQLKAVLAKSKNLQALRISHCTLLTDASLVYLADHHPRLKELYLSDNPGFKRIARSTIFGRPLTFPNLEILHLSRCANLTLVLINALKLKRENIKSKNCQKLTVVQNVALDLKKITASTSNQSTGQSSSSSSSASSPFSSVGFFDTRLDIVRHIGSERNAEELSNSPQKLERQENRPCFKIFAWGYIYAKKDALLSYYTGRPILSHDQVGVDFFTKIILVDGQSVQLQIWHGSAFERSAINIDTHYYRGSNVLLLFESCRSDNEMLRGLQVFEHDLEYLYPEIPWLAVGVQDQDADLRITTPEECKALALEKGAWAYYECTYQGEGVEEIMQAAAKIALENYHSAPKKGFNFGKH